MDGFYVELQGYRPAFFESLSDACKYCYLSSVDFNEHHFSLGIQNKGLIFRSAPYLAKNLVYFYDEQGCVAAFLDTYNFVSGVTLYSNYSNYILARNLYLHRVQIQFNQAAHCYETAFYYQSEESVNSKVCNN